MSRIPRWLLRHTVTVEPYEGDTAYGPAYGPPTLVRCFVEEGVRLVRDLEGHEVVSSARLFARLDAVCPAQSRVTLPTGRTSTAITALRRDAAGLPTPDHLEVHLV